MEKTEVGAESASAEPVPVDASASLQAERDALQAEKSEFQNMLLRQRADFENYKRRVEKDRLELGEFAAMDAVKALLPIVDDFERALTAPSTDAEYVRGMELIYQRTLDTLKKLGLEPLEAMGTKFDPHLHHAIEMVPSEEVEDQTIIGVYQRGYNFKGRSLRPAMVKVAVR